MGRRSQPQEAEVMSYNYTAYGQKDTKPFLGFNFAVSFFFGGMILVRTILGLTKS